MIFKKRIKQHTQTFSGKKNEEEIDENRNQSFFLFQVGKTFFDHGPKRLRIGLRQNRLLLFNFYPRFKSRGNQQQKSFNQKDSGNPVTLKNHRCYRQHQRVDGWINKRTDRISFL